MRRSYDMPFGAQVSETGSSVEFQIWAPGACSVALCLEDGDSPGEMAMEAQADGWFRLETRQAGPGSLYRFRIDDSMLVPDPASRFQPGDVHGPSQVVDPARWEWRDRSWRGRLWEEAIIYELHVGTFSPAGTFQAVTDRLDHLVDLGITAIELMPVADFPGKHNWGYDGVFWFAPDSAYGTPEDLKALIETAHERGLMVFLDVVYNHFGPEGNYLHQYAPQFFNQRHQTPWGDAINFDGPGNYWVRQFVIHNALFWIEEYNLDGLRLDAVHAICDDSEPDILEELAAEVSRSINPVRLVHLVLENDKNEAHYLNRGEAGGSPYAAQWNDDIHHALHVLLTGEQEGYYVDYAGDPLGCLIRCLAEGFAYQGESSAYRNGERRGEPSAHLPPTAFVGLLQNHDQIGNRAFGERINSLADEDAVRAAMAILLLCPSPPLLFMGQEWGATEPFPFFCDFETGLAEAVTEGRRREFAAFPEFSDPRARARIPDPMAPDTFASACLQWQASESEHAEAWLAWYRRALNVRRREIVPRLTKGLAGRQSVIAARVVHQAMLMPRAMEMVWKLADGSALTLLSNLSEQPVEDPPTPEGRVLFCSGTPSSGALPTVLAPWTSVWNLREGGSP